MVDVTTSDAAANRAAPPRAGDAGTGAVKLVCFCIHGQEYAADIADVKETLIMRPITRVFLTPPWLAGIINLRGDIVAVIDLARFSGLPPTNIGPDSRIIIFQHGGRTAGAVVDELAEVRTVARADIEAPPSTLTGDALALIAGVVTIDGEPLEVLDIGRLFQSERLRAFQRGR